MQYAKQSQFALHQSVPPTAGGSTMVNQLGMGSPLAMEAIMVSGGVTVFPMVIPHRISTGQFFTGVLSTFQIASSPATVGILQLQWQMDCSGH